MKIKCNVATPTAFLSENKNKIIMNFKMEDIDVKQALWDLIRAKGYPMIKQPLENKLDNLSAEDVKDIVVVVPLRSNNFNFEGYDCIRIGDIDMEESKVSSLAYNKKNVVSVEGDLTFPLLCLKLYSEGFREITVKQSDQ